MAILKIVQSYLFLVIAALALGLFLPQYGVLLAPHVAIFLGIIFFLSSFKIDLQETVAYLKDLKLLVVVGLFMLILFPLATYFVTLWLAPALALPFLILAAMPAGMTAPLLSEISGGRQDLALVLVVITSLLAPFTVPLMIKWLAGTMITVSFLSMFLSLAKIIFIPFILAQIVKHFWEKRIEPFEGKFKFISELLLMLLIVGVVAKQAGVILSGLGSGQTWFYLGALFVFFILIHLVGYFSIFWKHARDKISITVCLTYMNFTLAIYLADKFFNTPEIVVPIVLSVVPWALLLPAFKFIANRHSST